MTCSVLICTHNRAPLLRGALEALARQRMPDGGSWEVVVVDNASADSTAEVVGQLSADFPVPLRYLYQPELGHSRSLNEGIAICTGDVVAFTDDDAEPDADWLRQLLAAFEQKGADWAFGRVLPRWETRTPPAWFSERFMGLFALLDYGPRPFVVVDAGRPFYGVNCAATRTALAELSGYREDFGPKGKGGGVGADIDIFQRSLEAGLRVVYAPEALVWHVIPATRGSKAWQRAKVWRGTEDYYGLLRERVVHVPWLLGLPRYFYRQALADAAALARHVVHGRVSEAFYQELQLIRFVGLSYRAARRRVHGRPAA